MKKLLLKILNQWKWPITIISGVAVTITIFIFILSNKGYVGLYASSLIAYLFFISTVWNVSYVLLESVSENSSDGDVFSRWVLILSAFFFMIYIIFGEDKIM